LGSEAAALKAVQDAKIVEVGHIVWGWQGKFLFKPLISFWVLK